MANCNALQKKSLPTVESRSSVYDEVYLAMQGFLKTLRWFGLFPVRETVDSYSMSSIVSGLEFRLLSKYLLFAIAALLATFAFFYGIIWYHINLILNPIERTIMTTAVVVLCLGASGHIISTAFLARHWPIYFKNWQTIDQMLDIKSDKQLPRFVSIAHLVFISYAMSNMAMSLYSIILNFIYEYDESTSYPVAFAVAILAYTIYVSTSQILPEILFTCLCHAIHNRLRHLAKQLETLFSDVISARPTLQVTEKLENLSLAYQLIMKNIKYTNYIMDFALLLSCLVNAFTLSVVTYLVMRQTVKNFGVTGLKLLLAAMNLMRLVPVCLSAENIKVEVKKLNRIVFKAPVTQLSPIDQEHMLLFMRFVSHSPEHPFSALGFLHVNKGYINSVAGAIVTYTLALLQFDEQIMGNNEEICENSLGKQVLYTKNDTIYF